MSEPQVVWLYAIAAQAPGACIGGLCGVGGEPVRAVEAAGLTAVAGDVPLAEFGEAPLRRNLEDLAWLEATARAHHTVIEAVAQQGPVVPMRLATVYRDNASVAAALAARGDDFRAALRRITARTEWGVKAYASRPADRESGPAPVPQAGADQAAAEAGTGAAYLQRRRRELSARADSRRTATASADVIHDRLSRLAAAARLHPPQAPQLTGNDEQMLLNAAYLLDERRDEEFAGAVTALAGQHPAVRVELTGPWPPYSFAGVAAGRDGS
jgi:hypothetical protein